MFKEKPKEPLPQAAPDDAQAGQTQSEFPRKGQSQNGTSTGYSIEVRTSAKQPTQIGTMLLGHEWQRLKVDQVQPPFGVPIARPWNERIFSMLGLYDYAAAQALRWWFHASAEATPYAGAMCLESRIIAHTVKYAISEEAVSEHMQIQGDDRTNCIPDWGKPKP